MIREIFEKEFSHGNSSPPCSVFFCVVFAGTAGSYYLLTSLLIPSVHPGTTLDARDPRTARFSQSTPMPGAIFAVYALPADLDQGQKPISSGFTLGMRTPDFFSLCTVVSSPQTLSPIIWGEGWGGGGRYTGVHRQWVDRLFQAFR